MKGLGYHGIKVVIYKGVQQRGVSLDPVFDLYEMMLLPRSLDIKISIG
jgi:hypothetical protein